MEKPTPYDVMHKNSFASVVNALFAAYECMDDIDAAGYYESNDKNNAKYQTYLKSRKRMESS
jgi:hypothetical protein